MSPEESSLPYVDAHRITISASRERVWTALRRYVDSSLGAGARNPLGRLLGTEPRTGFEVVREIPNEWLGMGGRHRFARYRLVFELAEVGVEETVLTARTWAEFPGPRGRVYRALVIGGRGHVVAVTRMLRAVRRASLD